MKVETDFISAQQFVAPELAVNGDTPMGEAIVTGLNMLRARKDAYKANGISYYRPWVFMITDGAPTNSWQQAAQLIKEGEQSKAFSFYAVGVEGRTFRYAATNCSQRATEVEGVCNFENYLPGYLLHLAPYQNQQSATKVPLANPTAPNGWAIAG